MDDITLNRL
ncbi:hypothetical protein YPPY14_2227, partial [Yersinia pestis PY-14]